MPDLTHVHFYENDDKTSENLTIQGEAGKTVVLDALHFHTNLFPVNLTVRNITFDGAGVTPYGGISSALAVTNLTVDGCKFINGAYLSCANEMATNVKVTNSSFSGVAEGTTSIAITDSLTLDGNGKTLTCTGSDRAIDVASSVDADLPVKNLTLNCTGSYCQRGINYNTNGALSLDNVTVKGSNLSHAVNLPGSSDNATVTITKSDFPGCIALNIWGETLL